MRSHWWKAVLGCALLSCGSGDDDAAETPKSVVLSGTTACERYEALAAGLGCAKPAGCMIEAACDSLAVAWIDCSAKDTRQCMCESDDGLNCEGSFKANEGPALCSAEHQAYADCSGD
jgi:hypothetical protein